MSEKSYWLMKSEPSSYSFEDLKKEKTTWWEGVRSYQARNFMMNQMKVGDEVLFYHSNAQPSGIVGLATVHRSAQPDKSAQDKKSPYYDPKATAENPRWYCVQVKYKRPLERLIPLEEIKNIDALSGMLVIKKGMRLSIQPVTAQEYEIILALAAKASA